MKKLRENGWNWLNIWKSITELEKIATCKDKKNSIKDEIVKKYWEKGWNWLNNWKFKNQIEKENKIQGQFLMQLVAKLKEIKRKGWNWSTIKEIKDPRTKLKKNGKLGDPLKKFRGDTLSQRLFHFTENLVETVLNTKILLK